MNRKIGFIGLGIMGKPMATNLLKAGNELTVFDVVDAPLRELAHQGAKVSHSSKELSQQNDIVITMLADSPDVGKAAFGPNGVLESASEALVLGAKAGVDPRIVLKIIAGGYAMRVLDVRGHLILKRDFNPGFKTRLHHKDLGIALATGSEYGVPLPVLVRPEMVALWKV